MNGNDDLLVDPLDRSIYETVHGYVNPKTGKRGVLGLAPVVDMPASTLQNKANPSEQFAHLTVREARKVMLATDDHRILYQLAADLGEACVPLPTLEFAADMDLLDSWAEWQADVAKTIEAVRDALADKKVTLDEVARVRMELIADFEKGLSMLDVLKGMAEPEA